MIVIKRMEIHAIRLTVNFLLRVLVKPIMIKAELIITINDSATILPSPVCGKNFNNIKTISNVGKNAKRNFKKCMAFIVSPI
jgi:hypothetical protein